MAQLFLRRWPSDRRGEWLAVETTVSDLDRFETFHLLNSPVQSISLLFSQDIEKGLSHEKVLVG